MSTSTYENYFITRDMAPVNREVTFNLIEDEDGSTWWGYGHVDPDEFIAELNRWLDHTMGEAEPDFELDTRVDHLWARWTGPIDYESFEIVDEGTEDAFPVTRVWV